VALSNAERQRRYRERKSGQKKVPAETVEKLVNAGTAARVTRNDIDQLWAAFEAGLAARIFCEITQGLTGAEALLVDWLETEPAGLWLFHQFLAEQGLWGAFQDWSSSSAPSDVGRSVV